MNGTEPVGEETVTLDHREHSLSSVHKALALLNSLAGLESKAGLTELARRVGIPKPTAYRLLAVLAEAGIVERRGTDYLLGLRMFELGAAASRPKSVNLRERALPYLEDLYELTHETVSLAVLDGPEVLYVEKIHGHRSMPTPSHVGGRLPATCVALGKVMMAYANPGLVREIVSGPLPRMTRYSVSQPGRLLAELRKIRDAKVAYDIEEAQVGLTCVAAPIFDSGHRVAAAISMSGPTYRFDAKACERAVSRAAQLISTVVMPSLDPQHTDWKPEPGDPGQPAAPHGSPRHRA
ncbi:IclR family transcriptional regulator [Streptomyces sp. T028]|uniref:IclR family transcriptional regulator n=1 Tax=Streptomyces sp. T028 TaxID=3394379 RepID=UPI003A864010